MLYYHYPSNQYGLIRKIKGGLTYFIPVSTGIEFNDFNSCFSKKGIRPYSAN